MTAIDTSNWVDAEVHALSTPALTAFVNNDTNAYTLARFDEQGSGLQYRQFKGGLQVGAGLVRIPGSTTFSTTILEHGRYVRPPQALTWTGSQGQHIHYTLDLQAIRFYNNLQTGLYSGVIGLRLATWASSITSNYAFPNPNAASPEIDIYIIDPDDPDRYIYIENFPVNTFGFPSTLVFSTQSSPANSFIYRGAIGTTEDYYTNVVHNVAASQYTLHGSDDIVSFINGVSLQSIVAWRWHSQTAPWSFNFNVPRKTNPDDVLNQQGIYQGPQSHDYEIDNDSFLDTGVFGIAAAHNAAPDGSSYNSYLGTNATVGIGQFEVDVSHSSPSDDIVRPGFVGDGVFDIDAYIKSYNQEPEFSETGALDLHLTYRGGTVNVVDNVGGSGYPAWLPQ